MSNITKIFYLLLLVIFSTQLAAKEALDSTVSKHLIDDIHNALISDKKLSLCPETTDVGLDELVKTTVKNYGYGDLEVIDFLSGFNDSLANSCSLIPTLNSEGQRLMVKYAVKSGNKKLGTKTPEQKWFEHLSSQITSLQTVIQSKQKKIIIPKEVQQLEYMILGKTVADFCAEKKNLFIEAASICEDENDKQCIENVDKAYEELCKDNQYAIGTMDERLNKLGESFYSDSSEENRFKALKNQVEKVNDLRTKLGHQNWKSDMYWAGGSVMSVPTINAMTTGLALHVYPWYARAIQASLFDVDDGVRRLSLYVDIGSISGNADYTGTTYGLGVGFDIREGFILKIGGVYQKAANATSAYGYNNTAGITITSEFFQELME